MRATAIVVCVLWLGDVWAADGLTTPGMQFESPDAWRTAAPELYTEFAPDEIWAVRTNPLPELGGGLALVREPVKQGERAGRWADHPRFPTVHTTEIPHDWTGARGLCFWARSEFATGEVITLAVQSDGPGTPWLDYYFYEFRVDWTGWRELRLHLADFRPWEQPAGWQKADALYLFTKNSHRQPNPYTVLVLDDMRLSAEPGSADPAPLAPAPSPRQGTIPIHSEIAPFDFSLLNHPYPELRDRTTTPFRVRAYFQAERALFGYYPRYQPGFVSFDPAGKAYLQYGCGLIETLGSDGKWEVQNLLEEVIEPYAREQLGYTSLEPTDGGHGNETAIRWDRDGGMYVLANISELNSKWETRKALLLYSPGGRQGWQVFVLPEYLARFEKFVGHNPDCLNRPPVILLSHYLSPTRIYLLTPEKQADGTLRLPEPVLLAEDGVALVPHSGESNQVLTHGDRLIVTYGRLTVLAGHKQEDGVPSFARTYDLRTKELSEPVLIGFGGINAEDDHNWPGIAVDSKGILHVILNGHHDPFVHTHSLRPWDISEWAPPEKVAEGTSYAGLVCDAKDNLYSVTRHAEPGYYFRLSLHRKLAGQVWEEPRYLIVPYKPYYHVYYHKLTLDPVRQRLFLCYWAQTAALCLFRDEFYAARYMWPDREKAFLSGNPNLPTGSLATKEAAKYEFYSAPPSELCVLLSEDQGATWRLATTEDFR